MYNKKIIIEFSNCLIKSCLAKIVSLFLPETQFPDYLVSERGNDARDNGYVFFKYLCEKHPEIKSAYVISNESPDYPKVNKLGDTIEYGSFRHYIALFKAKYLVSSHIMGFTPNPGFYIAISKRKDIFKKKKVFLQHGITKDYIEGLRYPNTKVDLFICGAKPEYNYISSRYNYPNGVVKYTGLARFDKLNDVETRKEILLMPTWRKWVNSNTDEEFVKSEYFLRYQGLLSNKKLNVLLANNGYELVFYPHYEIQKFIHNFNAGEAVRIAKFSEYDVQDLLKRCEVLVTDYSSVYFDVAYMGKPIGFYQFDRNQFFESHYAHGYIEEGEIGYLTYSEEDLVNFIHLCIRNEYDLEEVNSYRKEFFLYHDSKNCERIFREIQAL